MSAARGMQNGLVLPDYDGGCLNNVLPAIVDRADGAPDWLPAGVASARQVVLLVLDGLGWEQLQERRALAPSLTSLTGAPITSVAPSTTATCLTSLTTGLPPAAHGVVGYRVAVGRREILNVLRWRTPAGDANETVPPEEFATRPPFRGLSPAVVTRAEFAGGGFTTAHLRGARLFGWRMPSTLVTHVRRLVAAGEPLVYAYYDGVDKVAHEYGLDDMYDAEVSAVDALVARMADAIPSGCALVVTSDHGQVDVGHAVVAVAPEVLAHTDFLSGEGRFRWLHARPGEDVALAERAREHHGDQAWVHTRDELVEGGWFGGQPTPDVLARLGDVALVARDPVAFLDPDDPVESRLVSRHGSVTAAEVLVPLLAHVG